MRKHAALLTVAAVLMAASARAQNAGHISAQVTRATVSHGPRVAPVQASNGTPVNWGDVVQTDNSGRARILLNDQSILTLGQRSRLAVIQHDASSQQTRLELAYGRIRCQVAKLTGAQSSFQIRTPTAVAGVIGTDFGADASNPGETRFVCVSGTTRIYSPDMSRYVDCGPGKTVTVRAGAPTTEVNDATPEQIERWKHITEPGDPLFADTVAGGRATPSAVPAPAPVLWHGMRIRGTWRFRPEIWDWFQDGAADNAYAFAQSILRLSIGGEHRNLEWQVELAQPTLLGLPQHSTAAAPQGALGLGATYFGSNSGRNAAYIFPSKAFLRFKNLGGSNTALTVGRFDFVDGTETVPGDTTLAALKAMRIAHRLIGNFQFTVTGRSHDGVWLSSNMDAVNLTLAAARPTRGVYQVDGLGELDVNWEYGALTIPTGLNRNHGELRLFGLGYQDNRAVTKTDNRPAAARGGADRFANLNLGTLGAHYLHAYRSQSAGTFDVLLWGAAQFGSWGVQRHRAAAFAAEAGWQPVAAWRPWLRAGYDYGSGDGDPADRDHNTFFQVLPTPRVYARFPFYDMENSGDAFAMLLLRPSGRLTLRSDAHWLRLASRRDLWYQGGGASSRSAFGYAGRPSNGNRGLGALWDLSADAQLTPHWGLGLYYGHVWGGGVQRSIYPDGRDANFAYAELLFRF